MPTNTQPWSILYIADGVLYSAGPFASEALALDWAKTHERHNNPDWGAFDINCQRVYLLRPDHTKQELGSADFFD